ncbi:MAG: hypothetical protein K8J31_03595 [Anaerolineae bacterium]|nr:hypothetical protein [Anaerolineae bacterium]
MSTHPDRWIEMQFDGTDALRIELNRRGHLWHGSASRLVSRSAVERGPLATVIGADFEAVRHQVIRTAHHALKH